MTIPFERTEELVNTQFAPVAALSAYYQDEQIFQPLEMVQLSMKTIVFSPTNKLIQVFLSILTGCPHLSVVNRDLERNNIPIWLA